MSEFTFENKSSLSHLHTLVKVFRIIPEFRFLRLKISLRMLNSAGINSFSDLV